MSALLQIVPRTALGLMQVTIAVTPPDHYANGLPFEADNSLAAEAANPVYHHQGIGFSANNRVCYAGGATPAPAYFGSGAAPFQLNNRLTFTLGGAADHYANSIAYLANGRLSAT